MPFLIKDFVNIMENIAPSCLKEDWDNVGLIIGKENTEVTNILVALDCTMEVIDEAIRLNCNLIFTHHPLIFSNISRINDGTFLGKKILKLIQNNINVFAAHTNLDLQIGGINDLFCETLGLTDIKIISNSQNKGLKNGFGRMSTIKSGILLKDFCYDICSKLQIQNLRYIGDENTVIYKPSFLNGSGSEFFKDVYELGSDCIVTGDTKYHLVNDYRELGVSIIDVGHFDTEWIPFKLFCKNLNSKLKELNVKEIIFSTAISSPYKYFSK